MICLCRRQASMVHTCDMQNLPSYLHLSFAWQMREHWCINHLCFVPELCEFSATRNLTYFLQTWPNKLGRCLSHLWCASEHYFLSCFSLKCCRKIISKSSCSTHHNSPSVCRWSLLAQNHANNNYKQARQALHQGYWQHDEPQQSVM